MSATDAAALRLARALVARPDGWCKDSAIEWVGGGNADNPGATRYWARGGADLVRKVVAETPVELCRFSALGAVLAARSRGPAKAALRRLCRAMPDGVCSSYPERGWFVRGDYGRVVAEWNAAEETTRDDVLAVFDRALERMGGRGS